VQGAHKWGGHGSRHLHAASARGGDGSEIAQDLASTEAPAQKISGEELVKATAKGLRVYNSTLDLLSALLLEGAPPLGNIFSANFEGKPPYLLPSLLLEANLIRPSNPETLQHFYDVLAALAPLRELVPVGTRCAGGVPLLQDYISFGRMVDIHPYDKLSCDWCSIINGAAEYLADLLAAHFHSADFDPRDFQLRGMPLDTPYRWSLRLHHLVPDTASALHAAEVPFEKANATVMVHKALNSACHSIEYSPEEAVQMEHRIWELVRPVLEMVWFGEAQEQRWCPFRHASEVALRLRPYLALDSQRQEELERALAIIRSEGRVTCRSCAVEFDRRMGDSDREGTVSPKLKAYYEALVDMHTPATS